MKCHNLKEFMPPSIQQTRSAIDNMEFSDEADPIYQNVLRYLFLTAGRICEVYGKYEPMGIDAYKIEINNVDVVLFAVKTARHKGKRRAVALPLDEELEPWSKKIYDLFSKHERENPFKVEKWKNNVAQRELQDRMSDIFKGHRWQITPYIYLEYREARESEIIRNEGTRFLIKQPNGEVLWQSDKKVRVSSNKIPAHSKQFTLQELRSQRLRDLTQNYKFTDEQLRTISGYKVHGIESLVTDWPVTQLTPKKTFESMQALAEIYFSNFL